MLWLCLICDACRLRCSWSGINCVASYMCSVLVFCVHPVSVLNVALCVVWHEISSYVWRIKEVTIWMRNTTTAL